MANRTCIKCGRSMDENTQFYQHKDGSKTDMCKKCLTMHIDNFNPDTFLWILEKMDVPYIPEEWNTLRDRAFAKNPNLTGMSVFGKYLSKMKLKQWKDFTWADSAKLQALNEEKRQTAAKEIEQFEAEMKQKYENGEISEAQYKTMVSTETQNEQLYMQPSIPAAADNPFANPSQFMDESELNDFSTDLSDDDRVYLAMKWGRLYKPAEWVELEKKYKDMEQSFDIQDADTINTLILICKTDLKMNQAIDCGDVEGFQKLSRVSDTLRKSAKFTAAQNKAEKNDFVDSVGELVAYCEKNGGQIPKYEIETPLDIIDKVIEDLKEYTRDLIYSDTTLAQQIENYIKKRENAEAMKRDRQEAKEKGLDVVEIEDEDYEEYYDDLEEQKKIDKESYEEEIEIEEGE